MLWGGGSVFLVRVPGCIPFFEFNSIVVSTHRLFYYIPNIFYVCDFFIFHNILSKSNIDEQLKQKGTWAQYTHKQLRLQTEVH